MNHLSEEQLILYYYGEECDADAGEHLAVCDSCRESYGALQRLLNTLDAVPAPEKAADYGAEVWRGIEGRLPRRARRRLAGMALPAFAWRWALAGTVMAALLVAAFLAGRFYSNQAPRPAQLAADPQVRERVLLVAVGDYLERSQMVLIELANANPKGKVDISAEQERATDLVNESRLYRQTAAHTGDSEVAGVLDELDRVLLDIAHAPPEMPARDLEKLRSRLAAQGILFKIRVVGSNLKNRQEEPAAGPPIRQKS